MTTGFILGKFMPLHRGHIHLIDYGRQRVEQLTVLVCAVQSQPILGRLRYAWVKELFPTVSVQYCDDEIPQYPHESPDDFWDIWYRTIRRYVPVGPDLVFTSEAYGDQLAAILGARHDCVDLDRSVFPVSGTAVRENPRAYWHLLPPPVQAYYASLA